MPNITEYNSKSEIHPQDRAINAAAEAAVVYQRAGSKIAGDIHEATDAVVRHMEVMETSELYKTGTELKMNLQKRYEEESALPENRNDPHFGDRFMAEVEPQLEEWGKGAGTEHGKMLAATLKSSIRNELFNHVAAGQAEMDYAHVDDNLTQTMNGLGAGLIVDPSEKNLRQTLGTADNVIQGMTGTIPDVEMRERAAVDYTHKYRSALVMSRYEGVGQSIKNQIAETGGETSPALDQLNKDVENQLGFQYISPEQQTQIKELGQKAVSQGQELYNSRNATAKSKMTEEGKGAYATLHSQLTAQTLQGLPPTPEQVTAIQNYASRYGTTNPGEAASLDDYLIRGQNRATNNEVQPFDQSVRDKIQTGFSYPKGDPRRPTQASLLQAYSHGQITKEDLSNDTSILEKLDKPETDPTFRPAWENFQRWQAQMVQGIGANNKAGAPAARAQFLHDSTAAFMAQGVNGWDKALDNTTNAQNPHSFSHVVKFYDNAANKGPGAAQYLREHDQFYPGANAAPAFGSKSAPVVPTHPAAPGHPAPARGPASAAEVKKADEIIWGKH